MQIFIQFSISQTKKSSSGSPDGTPNRPMNLFFHWSVFCAHLGMACVSVQRLVVNPHAFSHARLLHKKNYVLWGNRYDRTDNARKNCHRLSYRSSARGRNKTERMLVVPRNCFYLVTSQDVPHIVAPVCPKGAILLMPREMACAGMTAVVSDPNVIEEMNIWALCSELEFNSAFVAANRRIELELLKYELPSRHDACSSIV